MKVLESLSVLRFLRVPQFSMQPVSGDILDAGLTWMDASNALKSAAAAIRYEGLFVKKEYSLPDGVRYITSSNSRSLQPLCTNEDDSNAIMETDCGQTPAVEKS